MIHISTVDNRLQSSPAAIVGGIGMLDFTDLADRFKALRDRLEIGRQNERLFHEVHGFTLTDYSRLYQMLGIAYRYTKVSLQSISKHTL